MRVKIRIGILVGSAVLLATVLAAATAHDGARAASVPEAAIGAGPTGPGQMLADVVCMATAGATATVYGTVEKSVNPDVWFTPDWVGIYVTDDPDSFYGFFGVGPPPCDYETPGPVPFYHGNITVGSTGTSAMATGGGQAFAAGRAYVQFAFSAHSDSASDGSASGSIVLNWPAPGEPGTSGTDFAVGGGKHAGGLQFAFSAHSGANGENANGNIQLFIAGDMHPATVTCLIVSGNEAIMTATSDAVPGGIMVVDAVDNGGPTSGSPDLLRGSFEGYIYESPDRPGCFLPVLPPVPVDEGNIIVHDATG